VASVSIPAKRILVASSAAIACSLVAWLFVGQSAPLREALGGTESYLIGFNFVANATLPAALASAWLTGNWHDYYGPVYFAALFVLVFVVAYLALLLILRRSAQR
jgi:hypothetical protein